MKYLVLTRVLPSGRKQELPFLFPDDVPHADMLAALNVVYFGAASQVVSAGEAGFDAAPRCYGGSASLNLISRGADDGLLFQLHDINHGISNNNQLEDGQPRNG